MPVKTYPAPHGANAWERTHCSTNTTHLFRAACESESYKLKQMWVSSFDGLDEEYPIYGSRNGFVYAAIECYNLHHHLVIRPEDVWFAILSQFSFYVNEHAEELRNKFVAHQGSKNLEVPLGAKWGEVDFGGLAFKMSVEIQKKILDPDLRQWIMPAFTTTRKSDEVVACVLFMGAMQKYFSYTMGTFCGIPSVRLLGERSDWQKLLVRLDKLLTYGKETSEWFNLLKPVLQRFIRTFEAPDSPEIKDFWQKIVSCYNGGSGGSDLSGWITAFCFWDEKGKRVTSPVGGLDSVLPILHPSQYLGGHMWGGSEGVLRLTLDGVRYHRTKLESLPPGTAVVPVTVINEDTHEEYYTRIAAGSIGMTVTSSGYQMDTVQPLTGWFMYETTESRTI